MNIEEKKSELLCTIQQELRRSNIRIENEHLHSETVGKTWSIWIDLGNGSDTYKDKFVVDLHELGEGVDYFVAVGYRMHRWAKFLKESEKDPQGAKDQGRRMLPILMAEDDADDRFLIAKALEKNLVQNPFFTVSNGEELLDYLYHRGQFADSRRSPSPCFILLDLNMPRMDGREALRIIKKDEALRKIPVVILTTSQSEDDILSGYDIGANSYISKPANFDGFIRIIQTLQNYWLNMVELPAV